MSGDKNKFVSLKKNKDDKFILGNSAEPKFIGEGRAKLDKHIVVVDALVVQGTLEEI